MTRRGVPVRAAYEQTGALRRPCPQCDASPFQWCIDPRGRLRRVPCVLRTREPHTEPVGHPALPQPEGTAT